MNYARAIGAFACVILIGLGLWHLYHSGYAAGRDDVQVAWDKDKIKRADDEKAALIAYAGQLKHAQERHDEDQAVIDRLHDAAGRVRIHLPAACPGSAATGSNPDGGAGLLPDRVDQRFAEFQARVGRLFARCDQLNIDAIRANAGR